MSGKLFYAHVSLSTPNQINIKPDCRYSGVLIAEKIIVIEPQNLPSVLALLDSE
jgi:hypothetical protein